MQTQIIKLSEVLKSYPKSKSSIYLDIQNKTFPSQISLGSRSVGYILSEVNAVIHARIAGKSNEEIKELVLELEAQRMENGFIKEVH
jgi:prophage regulatory protein